MDGRFGTSESHQKTVETLVKSHLVAQNPADSRHTQIEETLKETIRAPNLNEPQQGHMGLGFNIEAALADETDDVSGALMEEIKKDNGSTVDAEMEALRGPGIKTDGISLIVDVHDYMDTAERDSKLEVGKGIDVNNKREDEHSAEAIVGLSENGILPVSEPELTSGDEGVEETSTEEQNRFKESDFVWGKIKSHPWWPGRIYSPSDASDYAVKHKQKDRLLVAYFGDGSFSWCYPSQLEHFEETFESMSEQSDSKSFVYAVQEAVNEFGRLVELEMTCSCKRSEDQNRKPLAGNGGIKGGVLAPEGGLGKLSIAQFEPAHLIADLKDMAKTVSENNVLELTVLKSRISAFYQAKGGYQLPVYCFPQPIVGLEDKDGISMRSNFNLVDAPQSEGPAEEDWLSPPTVPGYGQTSHPSLQPCCTVSEDKLYQRRKQKSMAELLEEAADTEFANNEHDMVTDGKKITSLRKQKSNAEADSGSGNKLSSSGRRGRKKKTVTENQGQHNNEGNGGEGEPKKPSARGRKRKASITKNDGQLVVVGSEELPLLTDSKESKDFTAGIDRGESVDAIQNSQKGLLSRERKRSKYLCPPFTTDLRKSVEHSSSHKESGSEFLQIGDVRAGTQAGSPPTIKCNPETSGKLSTEQAVHDTSGTQRSEELRKDEEMTIDIKKTRVSPDKVLSELHSVAVDHQEVQDESCLDDVKGFFSAFRSSLYREGCFYKVYHKSRRGRKRKSLCPGTGSVGKKLNQTDFLPDDGNISGSRVNKNNEAKLDVSKLRRAPVASDTKTDDKANGVSATSAILFMSFPPAVPLPTTDELISIYRRYGSLHEKETEVMPNSYHARVAFLRTADAELAFDGSVKNNPFGTIRVNFKLRYPLAPPRIDEVNEDFHTRVSPMPDDSGITEENACAKGSSQLNFIKQKLELMVSILETSDGNMSAQVKCNLQMEMKDLLEKVKAMAEVSA